MAKKESMQSYKSQKKLFKKIMLTMKKEKGELIKAEAEKRGLSVNKYIIDTVMKDIENNKL